MVRPWLRDGAAGHQSHRGITTDDNLANAFTQQQISDRWLRTDANGGNTSPFAERVGMNAGSRLPQASATRRSRW